MRVCPSSPVRAQCRPSNWDCESPSHGPDSRLQTRGRRGDRGFNGRTLEIKSVGGGRVFMLFPFAEMLRDNLRDHVIAAAKQVDTQCFRSFQGESHFSAGVSIRIMVAM